MRDGLYAEMRSVLRPHGPKTVCCNIHSLKSNRSQWTASVLYNPGLGLRASHGRALIICRFCAGSLSGGSPNDKKGESMREKRFTAIGPAASSLLAVLYAVSRCIGPDTF